MKDKNYFKILICNKFIKIQYKNIIEKIHNKIQNFNTLTKLKYIQRKLLNIGRLSLLQNISWLHVGTETFAKKFKREPATKWESLLNKTIGDIPENW